MGTVCRVLLAISLLWSLCALAQQPKPLLPDQKLTPGDVFDVTLRDICTPGHSKKVRSVPRSLRKQAYAQYGITSANEGDYQMDHLIPHLLAITLGLRRREIDLLEWQSFDFVAGTLRIMPTKWYQLKTNESASELPVEPKILELFRGWRARARVAITGHRGENSSHGG